MIITDQSHINRIREALWQLPEGCASVMVGAGFSRNARKAGPHAREFPLWQDITTLLCKRLYPPGDGDRLNRAMAEASGTSGFLRLAQEYMTAFGRVSLHNFIQELIPDDDYVPDDMHARLLRLPWRDVFTTNWDTLLERTRNFVVDRFYGVVRTYEELPSAQRPRIVKLHGSFPAHFPLIFTEEDYRTYPTNFAPYVNTVQQAMMETVFCLIGFSGDDPNFLQWSGWVRDNLGKLSPKIYLAGWLDLSPHRRRMLEERNVVPIDVARHPKASTWPDHLRHRYATEWILNTLERGRPYEVTEWPSPPDWIRVPVPNYLQPVEDVTIDAPVEEPRPHFTGKATLNLEEQVRNVVRSWEYNRKVYPGWLIIPPNKHLLIGMSMHDWEKAILQVVPKFSPIERLITLAELVWRLEKLLEPLSEQLEIAVQDVMDDIDCQSRRIGGIEDLSAKWTDIREAWRNLAMTLLIAARQRFDRENFDRRLLALCPFMDDHPDITQQIHHEKCLWALQSLDFATLDELLKQWILPEDCDPIWISRKAAILVEMGRNDETVRLLNRSMAIVRESPHHGRSLASPSREGWILWLALAFEHGFSRSTEEVMDAPPAFRRWKQLAALLCNAFTQKQEFLDALRGNPEKKDSPLFDLGARRGKTIRFSNAEYERWISSRRAIRLSEVAGLPPSASNMVVVSDLLSKAADFLATTDYPMASRLALRIATSERDEIFNRVWTRSRVAAMPMESVNALVELITNLISYAIPRITLSSEESEFWVTRLRVAFEALSRLVLRLPAERAESILKNALAYYRMEGIAKQRWLSESIDHLLARAWEALPRSHRSDLILDILSAPIIGLDGFDADGQFYPEPGNLIGIDSQRYTPTRQPENEVRWSEVIQLIRRGLTSAGHTRERAAIRLVPLAFLGILTVPEKNLLAQSLWHTDYISTDTLPSGTSLYDWIFLFLPEPKPGIAEQCFRKKWLCSIELNNERRLNEFFGQLGTALANLKEFDRPLSLTAVDRAKLSAMVENWITIPVTPDDGPLSRSNIHEGVIGLQFILPEIELSSSSSNALFAKAVELNQTNTPGFRMFYGIAKFLPGKIDEIAMSMRMGFASDKVELANEAIFGFHVWLRAVSEEGSLIPAPPDDLLREIGVIIATRRRGVLHRSLRVAQWVFSGGTKEQRDTIAQPALHGLRYLIEELCYDRDHGEDGELEIPLLRWSCAHLALSMLASGYQDDSTVALWSKVAIDDPLPEVRYAEGPASARSSEGSYSEN